MKNAGIGQRIKNLRLKMGYSQPGFAQQFKPAISKAAVSRWESGNRIPEPDKLKQIAEIGGTSVDYLLHGDVKNRISPLLKETNTTVHQLSEATKISEADINSYINGDEKPTVDDWINMADYFDVTISYLKGETWDRNGVLITTLSSFEDFVKMQGLHQEDTENLSSVEKEQISTTNFQFGVLLAALTTDIGSKGTKKENVKASKKALDNLTSIVNAWLIAYVGETNGESRSYLMSGINEVTKKYLQQLGKYLDQHKL